jgi:hypothetical protein
MAIMLSLGTLDQLALPRPPTPITAMFNRMLGGLLIKLGSTIEPKPKAVVCLKNILRE